MGRTLLKYLLVALATIVVATLAITATLLATFDPNDYRVALADALSKGLDRDVRISGDLELAPALVPTIAVNGVTIANPPWATRPTMASVGRLEGTIALLPLLERRIEIRKVVLERVDAVLERNAEHRGNWEFPFLMDAGAAAPMTPRYQTRIDAIELRAINVRYVDAETDFVTHVERITLDQRASGAYLIQGSGSLGDLPVKIEWRAGPFDDRGIDPELRWPVAGVVTLGDSTMTIDGRLRAPLAYTRSMLEWRIASTGASRLSRLIGTRSGAALAYSLAGALRVDADSVRIESLGGSIDNSLLVKNMRIDSGSIVVVRGERLVANLAGELAGQRFEVAGRLARLADMLAGADPWPVDVTASFGDQRFELAAMLDLEPGRSALRGLSLAVAGDRLTGDLEVAYSAPPRITANLGAPTLELTALIPRGSPASAVPILDRDLPLGWLDSADAAVELAIGELRGLPVPVRNAKLRTGLEDGAVTLVVDAAEIAGVDLTSRATLAASRSGLQLELDAQAPRVDLQRVLRAIAPDVDVDFSVAATTVSVALATAGTSIRSALAATAATLRAGPVEIRFSGDAAQPSATFSTARIDVDAGEPVKVEARGALSMPQSGGSELVVTATGGTLAELLATGRLWPAIEVGVDGEWRGAPVRISGRIADTAALLDREPTEFRLEGSWAVLEASAEGAIVPVATLLGTSARIALSTDDLAAAGQLTGAPELPAGRAALAGRVTIGEQQWDVSDFTVTAPGAAGTGSASVNRTDRIAVRGRLDLSLLDFTPYAGVTRGAVGEDIALHRLYSSQPVPLDALRRRDWDLELDAEVLRFGAFVSNDVRLRLSVDGGALDLDAAFDTGRMSTTARIDARMDEPELSLRVSASGIALAADRSGAPAAGTPVIDLEAQLSGRGISSQAVVRSLDGDLLMYLRGGRIESGGLRFLFGSVLYQVLDVINPFSARSPYVDIDCAGVYFTVADGVVSTEKGIVMQTPQVQIVGLGSTNLATGELTMQFRTKARTGVVSVGGIVNEFVELTGTLDAPRVAISAERAARTGILAVITGGLSILATDLFKRMTAGDVCPELPSIVGAPGAQAP
jgi:uncharacterized protein involved in outer membrane biogenesis